jgi:hypothetical protein
MQTRISVALDGEKLQADVLALLSRLEVRESDTDPTVAALRFNLSQMPSGEFSPLDDEIFLPGARLSLDVEAPGSNLARLFEGYLTHVRPHFEGIESNCYVEVLAMDAAVLLGAEERAATYPDMTDSEAVERVLERYKIPLSIEPTGARHDERKQLLVQRASDWDFVCSLARRNGYVCYFEPDASGKTLAHFKHRALGDTPQADLTMLREGSNLQWLDIQFVMTGPVRYVGAAIDPIAKRLVRGEGEPEERPLGDALLDQAVARGLTAAGATGAQAFLRNPAALEEVIRVEATAATDRAMFAIEARGELDPALYRGLLRARRPVLIKGIGRTFAGLFYVRAVRTVFEEGALSQTFVAERNAVGLSGKEDFGKVAEEVPPQ